ncbi:MAG: signal peptidase I [Euryarchaeota archaeon]|nr:signal peptidase I [Euryarchaeota archaeon]
MKIRPGTLALVVLIIIVAIIIISSFAGYRYDTIRSGSMAPEIEAGDLLISVPIEPENIEIGDKILYRSQEGVIVCHRVINIDHASRYIETKGDANPTPDTDKIPFSSVVGKSIVSIPYLGYVVAFLGSIYGIASVAAVLVTIYLLKEKVLKDSI